MTHISSETIGKASKTGLAKHTTMNRRQALAGSLALAAASTSLPAALSGDTNSNPDGIDYLVPGNDDAMRSISLFTRAVSDACLEGSKLATGLKPNPENEGPKILKKGEKEPLESDDEIKREVSESKGTEKNKEE